MQILGIDSFLLLLTEIIKVVLAPMFSASTNIRKLFFLDLVLYSSWFTIISHLRMPDYAAMENL